MTGGWFRTYRASLRSKWYRDTTTLVRCLWWELMALAEFEPGVSTETGFPIKPGQLDTTWNDLAMALSEVNRGVRKVPTVAIIRRAMQQLKKAGEVDFRPIQIATCKKRKMADQAADLPADPPARQAADPHQSVGIRVTLLRWALQESDEVRHIAQAADPTADVAAGGSFREAADISLKKQLPRNNSTRARDRIYPTKPDHPPPPGTPTVEDMRRLESERIEKQRAERAERESK